jgi:hypothetical protein
MRLVIGLLVTLGIVLMAFGYWGLETAAGRQAFDEMAGTIPFGAQVLGVVLLAAASVIAIVHYCWQRMPGRGRRQ